VKLFFALWADPEANTTRAFGPGFFQNIIKGMPSPAGPMQAIVRLPPLPRQ
jgi:hypothetical protein